MVFSAAKTMMYKFGGTSQKLLFRVRSFSVSNVKAFQAHASYAVRFSYVAGVRLKIAHLGKNAIRSTTLKRSWNWLV